MEQIIAVLRLSEEQFYTSALNSGAEIGLVFRREGKPCGIEFKHSEAPKTTKSYDSKLEVPEFILNILILVIAIFVQAGLFAVLGTTPGKAMLRVSVRNADGSKLGFPTALAREARVFLSGLGLGIPLVALITHIASYSKLTSEGITSWDRTGNLVVSHQTIGTLRWILMVAVLVSFIALVVYGSTP